MKITLIVVLSVVAAGCAKTCYVKGNWVETAFMTKPSDSKAYRPIEFNFCDDGTLRWREGAVAP